MPTHDGPFNGESNFFHSGRLNIGPRPGQQPHPPVWSTTGSKSNARVLGERGYVMAVLGSGHNTRMLYDSYRWGYAVRHNCAVPDPDRLAYLGLFAIAGHAKETRPRGGLVAGY